VDDAIGQIVAQLAADGRLANTVFLFLSDNGLALGEYRFDRKPRDFEICHRVPFVASCPVAVCGPLAPGGAVDQTHVVLNLDLAPTMAALAGVAPSSPVDGASLVPLLDGTATSWRDSYVIEDWISGHEDHGLVQDRRDGHTWVYVELPLSGQQELYDLTADPNELHNLWHDPASQAVLSDMAAPLHAAIDPPRSPYPGRAARPPRRAPPSPGRRMSLPRSPAGWTPGPSSPAVRARRGPRRSAPSTRDRTPSPFGPPTPTAACRSRPGRLRSTSPRLPSR